MWFFCVLAEISVATKQTVSESFRLTKFSISKIYSVLTDGTIRNQTKKLIQRFQNYLNERNRLARLARIEARRQKQFEHYRYHNPIIKSQPLETENLDENFNIEVQFLNENCDEDEKLIKSSLLELPPLPKKQNEIEDSHDLHDLEKTIDGFKDDDEKEFNTNEFKENLTSHEQLMSLEQQIHRLTEQMSMLRRSERSLSTQSEGKVYDYENENNFEMEFGNDNENLEGFKAQKMELSSQPPPIPSQLLKPICNFEKELRNNQNSTQKDFSNKENLCLEVEANKENEGLLPPSPPLFLTPSNTIDVTSSPSKLSFNSSKPSSPNNLILKEIKQSSFLNADTVELINKSLRNEENINISKSALKEEKRFESLPPPFLPLEDNLNPNYVNDDLRDESNDKYLSKKATLENDKLSNSCEDFINTHFLLNKKLQNPESRLLLRKTDLQRSPGGTPLNRKRPNTYSDQLVVALSEKFRNVNVKEERIDSIENSPISNCTSLDLNDCSFDDSDTTEDVNPTSDISSTKLSSQENKAKTIVSIEKEQNFTENRSSSRSTSFCSLPSINIGNANIKNNA